MVCVRVAFHENDEDNSDSYEQGVECWIRGNHGNHENDDHGNPGCKPRVPQTTGLKILENVQSLRRFRNSRAIPQKDNLLLLLSI